MRPHNYYAAPGFERAGLRRRDSGWIVERIADPAGLFVPVWRNQNLIIEIDGAEPRAVVLGWGGLVPLIGDRGVAEERLARGEMDAASSSAEVSLQLARRLTRSTLHGACAAR